MACDYSSEIITNTLEATIKYGAAVPGTTPVDTQKLMNDDGFIIQHLKRSNMTAVQTPQGFLFNELLAAHYKAKEEY